MTDAFVPPSRPRTDFGASDQQASQRCSLRVAGPFAGRRMKPLPTPLRIHDLSSDGCLLEPYDDIAIGQRITIQLDLPTDSWITLDAEILYLRDKVRFAVRFVDVIEPNRHRLARTIEQLAVARTRSDGGWTLGQA